MHKHVYMSEINLTVSAAILIVCHLQSSSITADTTFLLIWSGDNTEKPFTLIAALQTATPTLSTCSKQLQGERRQTTLKKAENFKKLCECTKAVS